MEYGYQKVLEVQRRCGVSFEAADKALKAEKGDVDKASAFAMRKKKTNEVLNKNIGSFKNFISYRVIIRKNEEIKFDISMGIVLLISLLISIFSFEIDGFTVLFIAYLVIFAITIFSGYSLEFVPGKKKEEPKIVKLAQEEKTEEEVYEENAEQEVELEDNGYNSIEIE